MHGTRDELVPLPPPFEIVLRGFDRQQVIDHVNALKTRVTILAAERDAALQQAAVLNDELGLLRRDASEAARHIDGLRREALEAASELDRLQRSPLTAATARIKHMLQMAEDEAAELREAAEHESTSLRESARTEADHLLTETQRRCERLEAASSGQRHQAEEQSERDIASRQAEMDAWLRDFQTRSIAALYLLMQLAGERLSSRVVKVKRQVSAAKVLRSEVADQLSAVQRLLAEALGVVDMPTPAEQAEQAEQTEPAEQVTPAEQTEPADPTGPAEPAEKAEPSSDALQPRPTRRAGRPGDSSEKSQQGASQQQERSESRSEPADQPAARFGLHPY